MVMILGKEKSQPRQKQQAVRPALGCKFTSDPGDSEDRETGEQQLPQVETKSTGRRKAGDKIQSGLPLF